MKINEMPEYRELGEYGEMGKESYKNKSDEDIDEMKRFLVSMDIDELFDEIYDLQAKGELTREVLEKKYNEIVEKISLIYIKMDLNLLKQIDNYVKSFTSFGINISREKMFADINKRKGDNVQSLGLANSNYLNNNVNESNTRPKEKDLDTVLANFQETLESLFDRSHGR